MGDRCECGHVKADHHVNTWNQTMAPCAHRDELGRKCRCVDYEARR